MTSLIDNVGGSPEAFGGRQQRHEALLDGLMNGFVISLI